MEVIVGSKESLGLSFKDSICTKFYVKLWFDGNW